MIICNYFSFKIKHTFDSKKRNEIQFSDAREIIPSEKLEKRNVNSNLVLQL